MLWPVAPRPAMPHPDMPCPVMPCPFVRCPVAPCLVVPCPVAPCPVAPRPVAPRPAPSCHATSCHAPCVMLRPVVPRPVVPCPVAPQPRRAAAPSRRSPSRRAPSCSAPSCRAPTTQTRMPIGLGWPAQRKRKKVSNKQSGLPGCRTKHELSIGVRVRASFSITCSPPILATSCQALAALGERERPITSQRHHQARAPKLQCPWLYYNDLKRPHGAPWRGGRRAAWT